MSYQKTPPLTTRIATYEEEYAKWEAAGKPVRTRDEIRQLYDTYCQNCPHYSGWLCRICGCLVNRTIGLNKLRWATTECPDDPPRWGTDIDTTEIKVDETAKVAAPPPVVAPVKPKPKKGGCGCGG